MHSLLALLLCTLFVLYLLRFDRRQPNQVSSALWIPTVWIFSIATKPLGSWFGQVSESVESGSPLDRVFVSGLLCLGLLTLAKRKLDWSRFIKENTWLLVLIGYMLVSILWSDIPFISLKRWIREFTAVVMALLVLTEPSPRHAMESLLRRTTYILIPFSLLLIKFFPQYGVQWGHWSGELMWVGVTMQKNGLGRLCLISAFFLVWTLMKRWLRKDIPVHRYQTHAEVFLLLLTLWLLKGPSTWAGSATGFVTLASGVATYGGLLWMKKNRLYFYALITIIGLIIAIGIATPLVQGSSLAGFTSIVGRDATFTGRTDIWEQLVPLAKRHFVLGYGFGGFWTSETEADAMVNESHNGYLEVLLQLGFVGVVLTSIFLLSCGRKALRTLAHDFDWGSLTICFVIMTVLHNITESSINTFTSHLMANTLFLSVAILAPTVRRTPGVRHEQSLYGEKDGPPGNVEIAKLHKGHAVHLI